jgi:large subunit ribosomal protein L18
MKREIFLRRKKRVKSKISANQKRPRLSVFRSNTAIYAQIIDDGKKITLVSANEKELKIDGKKKVSKTDRAGMLGELIAGKATTKKIKEIVFDKSGYKYHGRVAALAEGARRGGLKF